MHVYGKGFVVYSSGGVYGKGITVLWIGHFICQDHYSHEIDLCDMVLCLPRGKLLNFPVITEKLPYTLFFILAVSV